MKNFVRVASASALLALSLSVAKADPIDMSTITCAQASQMKTDEAAFVLIWVAGYMAGTAEETSMDPDILGKAVDDMVAYCKENQEMSVMNAAKEVAAK